MGDWNEQCIGNSTSSKLCRDHNLVDLWNFHHPETEFRTYQRGSNRIDFAVVSSSLATKIDIVYEPFQYRLKGDHRAMILQFDSKTVFGSSQVHKPPNTKRILSSKDKKDRYGSEYHEFDLVKGRNLNEAMQEKEQHQRTLYYLLQKNYL